MLYENQIVIFFSILSVMDHLGFAIEPSSFNR